MTIEEKHNLPQFCLVSIDETEGWNMNVLGEDVGECVIDKIKSIKGVHLYDKNRATRLCEMTPSYELYFLYNEIEYDLDVSDKLVEKIEDTVSWWNSNRNYVSYCHIYEIDDNSHKYIMPIYNWEDYYEWCEEEDKDPIEEDSYEKWYDEMLEKSIEYYTANRVL
jgi:hypothetical protein